MSEMGANPLGVAENSPKRQLLLGGGGSTWYMPDTLSEMTCLTLTDM